MASGTDGKPGERFVIPSQRFLETVNRIEGGGTFDASSIPDADFEQAFGLPSDEELVADALLSSAKATTKAKDKAHFWTTPSVFLDFDPKSQFRWRVRIPGLNLKDTSASPDEVDVVRRSILADASGDTVWYAKTIDKPTYAVKNMVDGRYPVDGVLATPKITATSPELKPVTMTLVDPVSPGSTRALARYLRNAGFQEKAKPDNATRAYLGTNYPSALPGGPEPTHGEMYIEQLDARGVILERWTLIDPYPIEVNFGKLDYSSDNLVEISVTWGYRTFKVFFPAIGDEPEMEYFAEIPAANSLGGGAAGGLPGT
tara:strand:- start:381 stop:1325 length:945 start_codon:yes stop_codon:yes gene_type:complete